MMSPRNHERLSVVLLAIAISIIFLGYDVQAFFAESVIHSIHDVSPGTISQYAGYYGQAIHYFGFAFFSLFTASFNTVISSKVALVVVSVLFGSYYIGFYHVNAVYYYSTQLLMGLGYALCNNAEGQYLAEHSSEKTLLLNSGLETGISHISLAMAGIFIIIFNYCFMDSIDHGTNYHHFSLDFIQITYSGLLALTVVGGIIFALLPTKQQEDAFARKTEPEPFHPKRTVTRMVSAMSHPNVLLLAVTSAYQGFFNSFSMGVYTTSMTFTHSLKSDVYLMGFYSLFTGIAEITGFMVISPLMDLVPKHRLLVNIGVHLITMLMGLALIVCTVPNYSTIRPTDDEDILLAPGRWSVCLTGFIFGIADYALTLGRAVICQIAVPEARAEVFSLTRMFMSIAACSILFIAPYLTVRLWCSIMCVGAISGTITYAIVARREGHRIRPAMVVEEKA